MKVLILAAGRGTRLRPFTAKKPKSAIEVCGIPLILRNLFFLEKLGLSVVVVVGHKAEELTKLLKGKAQIVYNDNLDKGNAYSVLCAKEALKGEEKFLVLMGDHLYSFEFLRDALDAPANSVIVCRENETIETDEATKILAEDGKVVEIGKNLEKWNYIDTGAFMCTPRIFETLDDIFAKKSSAEWSEAVKAAKMSVYEVDEFWVDIDTPEDVKRAENALLKSLIKPEDGIISRNLNRKLSLRISKFLCRYDVSPNVISLFSFLLSLAAASLFFSGSYLLGGLLAQISSVMDGVDGEIARLKFQTSKFGGFYDALLDRYADALILAGIFLSLPFNLLNFFSFLFAVLGASLVSYTASKFYETFKVRAESLERRLKFIPGKRDERLFLVFVFSVFAEFYAATALMFALLVSLAVLTNARAAGRLLIAKRLEPEVTSSPN